MQGRMVEVGYGFKHEPANLAQRMTLISNEISLKEHSDGYGVVSTQGTAPTRHRIDVVIVQPESGGISILSAACFNRRLF